MQTVAAEWRLYSHTFQGYGRGVRRALLILRGRDDQFWAGAVYVRAAGVVGTASCGRVRLLQGFLGIQKRPILGGCGSSKRIWDQFWGGCGFSI